jgi:hypothetical protein
VTSTTHAALLEKVQQLKAKLDLERQQVDVLTELWDSWFPYPHFDLAPAQFRNWLRKYEWDIIIAAFEKGADFISTQNQKIETGAEDAMPEPPARLNLVLYVSKTMVLKTAEAKVKAGRRER